MTKKDNDVIRVSFLEVAIELQDIITIIIVIVFNNEGRMKNGTHDEWTRDEGEKKRKKKLCSPHHQSS